VLQTFEKILTMALSHYLLTLKTSFLIIALVISGFEGNYYSYFLKKSESCFSV